MKKRLVFFGVAAAALLCACQSPAPPASVWEETSALSKARAVQPAQDTPEQAAAQGESIQDQINALYAKLDTARLPLVQDDWWYSLDPKRDMDILPPQLVLDEPQAYLLSNHVRNLLFYAGNRLYDFTELEYVDQTGVLLTALYHTARIDIPGEWMAGDYNAGPPNHLLAAIMCREAASGRYVSQLYYVRDVEQTIRTLFGEKLQVAHQDLEGYYHYDQKAGVYLQLGDFNAGTWIYPQITRYEKTGDGYRCDAVLVEARDAAFPLLAADGTQLTRENFAKATANNPKYRYTFREEPDGRLVLTALETLRAPERGRS